MNFSDLICNGVLVECRAEAAQAVITAVNQKLMLYVISSLIFGFAIGFVSRKYFNEWFEW